MIGRGKRQGQPANLEVSGPLPYSRFLISLDPNAFSHFRFAKLGYLLFMTTCHPQLPIPTPLGAGDKAAGLSQMALWYAGGLLKHARALSALIAPCTNSYKRLVPGYEAP